MVSALTYQEGQFHLAKELDEFKHELDGDGFGTSIAPSCSGRCLPLSTGISTPRLGGPHGQAGGSGQATGRLRIGGFRNQTCTGLPEGARRHVRSITSLWTPARTARRIFSVVPATGRRSARPAEPLALGNFVYWMVWWSQHRPSDAGSGRSPRVGERQADRVQRRRSRRSGSAVSRAIRWSKRPCTCLSALSHVASTAFAGHAGTPSRPWPFALCSWNPGVGVRFV